MAIDTTAPRSRRALLAASIGGLAAVTAQALGRPLTANAADGNAVVVGGEYTSSSVTKISDTGGDIAIWGASPSNVGTLGTSTSNAGVQGESNSGYGVYGYSENGGGVRAQAAAGGPGIYATSSSGHAVFAAAGAGDGVQASSTSGVGVRASSASASGVVGTSTNGSGVAGISVHSHGALGSSTNGYGVYGESGNGHGVYGFGPGGGVHGISHVGAGVTGQTAGTTGIYGVVVSGTAPAPPSKTGVYGRATLDADSRGVHGHSTAGRGVFGQATSGNGVRGYATSGIAGYFLSASPSTGTALRAAGKVAFDHCAGVATIASGTSTIAVTPGIDLTSTSAVVATLMGNAGGSTAVKRVAVNTTGNSFTIYLTANSTATVKVAWHVFG